MEPEAKALFEPWREDETGLHKEFRFPDFPQALGFAVEVARLAEAANHHPDIDLRFNRVLLTLMTHDAGRITDKDRSLAAEIDHIPASAVADRSRSLFS